MTNDQEDSLESTRRLRKELQLEIARLQLAIEIASQTIAQARLAIVQLSISEDRLYAQGHSADRVWSERPSVSPPPQ